MPKTLRIRLRKIGPPIIRRVVFEPHKIGAAFQEMMEFINGRTISRVEIVAEEAELERTSAKKLRRRVVAREHRLVVEMKQPALRFPIDKRRRRA